MAFVLHLDSIYGRGIPTFTIKTTILPHIPSIYVFFGCYNVSLGTCYYGGICNCLVFWHNFGSSKYFLKQPVIEVTKITETVGNLKQKLKYVVSPSVLRRANVSMLLLVRQQAGDFFS